MAQEASDLFVMITLEPDRLLCFNRCTIISCSTHSIGNLVAVKYTNQRYLSELIKFTFSRENNSTDSRC